MFDTTLGGVLVFRVGFEKDVWLLVCCLGSWLMAQQEQRKSSSRSSSSSRRTSNSRRQQNLSKNVVLLLAAAGNRICRKMLFFQDFRRHVRQFFSVVLSQAWCFPSPTGDCFEAVLLLAAAGNRICRIICRKMLFSRISDDTLGTFLAWFWN